MRVCRILRNGIENIKPNQFPKRISIGTHKIERFFSTSPNSSEDAVLQKSFDDTARFKLLISQLFNTELMKQAEKLLANNVVNTFPDAYLLCVDLQNPLVKKYKLDIVEFSGAVAGAIKKIWKAGASKEFFDYANGLREDSFDADYIKENCHPRFRKMQIKNLDTEIAEVYTVNDANVGWVSHGINIPYKIYAGTKSQPPLQNDRHLDKAFIESWNAKYFPPGCVIGKIAVEYEAYEKDEYIIQGKKTESELVTKGLCTFYGCISGQTELEWKIVGFDIR